ncbi:MAG: hypothetical protein MIO92_00220, partial [Methanosarcinaceae archaeon]|nr:hypothetical protein [Methanosarcinaceae archaeon]
MEKDTIVFVRSCGERTTEKCRSLLPGSILISEIPFSKTIRKCFEIAIESDVKHIVCCDADVIPAKNMVKII